MFQIFVKFDYFKEKNVLIIQNILAIATFTIILYSFFPLVELVYIDFTSDPTLILISRIMIHSVIILTITLISLYFLYIHVHLYEKPRKFFNYCVIIIFLLIDITTVALVNFRNILLGVIEIFQRDLFLSTILFSISFLLFVLFNYLIHAFNREISVSLTYNTGWFLISSIFLVLIGLYWNIITIIFFSLILITILSLLNLKFGNFIKCC